MMQLSDEQLEALTRTELIALVKELLTTVQQLQSRVAELETEVRQLRTPPPTSRNSSPPPSRDPKSNLSSRGRKRVGAKPGHERAVRALVEKPDQIIEAAVEQCSQCQADLRGVAPRAVVRRQLTELPPVTPVVIETREHEVVCPQCQSVQRGLLPEALAAGRQFGPRLGATVLYLKQEQHLSYERLAEVCQELFGVAISAGGINCLRQRAGTAAQPVAAEIGRQVARSAIIGSDETSARVQGRNWWQWVFRSEAGVYHTIAPTRSAQVITAFMGECRAECWVCDCFSAQLKAPAEHFQLCLAHQLRDVQRLIEARPHLCWAMEMQSLFREAIHLWKRVADLTLNGYLRRVMELEARLDRLLERRVKGAEAKRLRQRYVEHREHLFTFLHFPGVPPDNNACERALRPSVIHRKVTNGFRSEWGAQAYAAVLTVTETAKHQGRRVFEALLDLMGAPILHFLAPQNS